MEEGVTLVNKLILKFLYPLEITLYSMTKSGIMARNEKRQTSQYMSLSFLLRTLMDAMLLLFIDGILFK